MRIAALLVAFFAITIGIVGIVSPDGLTVARRQVMNTPGALYATGAVRVAMGIVLVLFARRSRAPKMLFVIGIVMVLQGLIPQFLGLDRGRAILEQEALLGTALLRVGAVVALASGAFIAFAVMPRQNVPCVFK